jgi:hypothetical protein
MGSKQPRGNKLPPIISEFKEVSIMKRRAALELEAKIIKPFSATKAPLEAANCI